jgi:hypothetical protein
MRLWFVLIFDLLFADLPGGERGEACLSQEWEKFQGGFVTSAKRKFFPPMRDARPAFLIPLLDLFPSRFLCR